MFPSKTIEFAEQRIPVLNEYCVVCDEPHVFQNGPMLRVSAFVYKYITSHALFGAHASDIFFFLQKYVIIYSKVGKLLFIVIFKHQYNIIYYIKFYMKWVQGTHQSGFSSSTSASFTFFSLDNHMGLYASVALTRAQGLG